MATYPDLATAVLGEVAAAVPGYAVFDAQVVGTTPDRYVLVHVAEPRSDAATTDGVFRDRGGEFMVTCVASLPGTDASPGPLARWLQRKVRDRLCGLRMDVTGFEQAVIVANTVALPPDSDEEVRDRAVVYTKDEFALIATK